MAPTKCLDLHTTYLQQTSKRPKPGAVLEDVAWTAEHWGCISSVTPLGHVLSGPIVNGGRDWGAGDVMSAVAEQAPACDNVAWSRTGPLATEKETDRERERERQREREREKERKRERKREGGREGEREIRVGIWYMLKGSFLKGALGGTFAWCATLRAVS